MNAADIIILILYALFGLWVALYTEKFPERRTILVMVWGALGLRVIFSMLHAWMCAQRNVPDLMPDAGNYSAWAMYIAETITGRHMPDFAAVALRRQEMQGALPALGSYQVSLFTYAQGILYAIFGYSSLTLKLLNGLFSVCTGFLIYGFVRAWWTPRAALFAAGAVLFFPSLFLWSVSGLKDTSLLLACVLLVCIVSRLLTHPLPLWHSLTYALAATLITFLINTLRYKLSLLIMAFFGISLLNALLVASRKAVKGWTVIGFTGIVFLLANPPITSKLLNTVDKITIPYQVGQYLEKGNTSYRIYPQRFYESLEPLTVVLNDPQKFPERLRSTVLGAVYFLYSPFITHTLRNPLLFPAFLQGVFLLAATPFMISGLWRALKKHPRAFTAPAVFLLIFWVSGGMMSGNVGTTFRQKDILVPVFLLFSAIGADGALSRIKKNKQQCQKNRS
jgi:hypothetical protein